MLVKTTNDLFNCFYCFSTIIFSLTSFTVLLDGVWIGEVRDSER